jgi:pyrroline-5-carboxylate reductase
MNKIGIIGYGNMGSSIAGRIGNLYEVIVFDKDNKKTKGIVGIKIALDIKELIRESEIIILAVKPQVYPEVLEEIKKSLSADKLFVSIAAGISTNYIEKVLGSVRVIRAMPNISLKIGAGMTCISKGKFANNQDFDFIEQFFNRMGETIKIEEQMMNQATAVSGSGPGLFYYFLEKEKIKDSNIPDNFKIWFKDSLAKAAREVGFNVQYAMILANGTVMGSCALLSESGLSAPELRKQVTSKGGTTEAGLKILEKGGSLEEAVKAAFKRAEELAAS